MVQSKGGTPDRFARWRRVSLRSRGVAVLAFPMAVLFAALFTIYGAETDVRNAGQIVARSYDARAGILILHSSLVDAEAARRGYLATGQSALLATYRNSLAAIAASAARLPLLAGDTSAALTPLHRIQALLPEELALLDQLPAHPDQENSTMASLQANLTLLSDEEERILAGARYLRDLARQRVFRTIIACGICGPLGALFIHLLVTGRLVRRIEIVEENARRLAHGIA